MRTGRHIVVEDDPSGHRLVFVGLVLEHLRVSLKDSGLAISGRVADSPAVKLLTDGLNSECVTVYDESNSLSEIAATLSLGPSDSMIVPDGDTHLRQLWRSAFRLRHPRVHLLIMQNPSWILRRWWEYPLSVVVSNVGKQIVLGVYRLSPVLKVRYLTFPRPTGDETQSRRDWLKPGRRRFVQDPVLVDPNPVPIKDRPSLDADRVWVGMVGGITSRKHPDVLCQAALSVSDAACQKLGLAFLGPMTSRMELEIESKREELALRGVHIVVDNRRRLNSEMNADVKDLDAVAIIYSTSAPNSTCAKAAYYGRPLIAAGPTQFRQFVTLISGQPSSPIEVNRVADRLEQVVLNRGVVTPRKFDPPVVFAKELLGK